ncbi:MAG: S-formylglutathione hydrolase [Porticoccaceae bacterium]|nr:S-formylglutathione hydrolase [Porticoccaceae bacterium]
MPRNLKQLSVNKIFDGQQIQYGHQSDVLDCEMQFSIFLPVEAETKPVPVLYWLSGLTCNDLNFVTKAGAQQYAAEFGVAIVCPDTSPRGENIPDDPEGGWDFGLGAGFYLNATEKPWAKNYRMYDYVVEELPEVVHANFALDSERQSIFGHSMGGHGALTIGLKNPQTYRSVSAFSPIVAPTKCPWGKKAFGNYLGKGKKAWKQYDACELLKKSKEHVPILIDQGEADDFLEEQLLTENIIKAAEKSKYPMQVRFQPGYDHSYFFIASFVRDHIEFHSQFLL